MIPFTASIIIIRSHHDNDTKRKFNFRSIQMSDLVYSLYVNIIYRLILILLFHLLSDDYPYYEHSLFLHTHTCQGVHIPRSVLCTIYVYLNRYPKQGHCTNYYIFLLFRVCVCVCRHTCVIYPLSFSVLFMCLIKKRSLFSIDR